MTEIFPISFSSSSSCRSPCRRQGLSNEVDGQYLLASRSSVFFINIRAFTAIRSEFFAFYKFEQHKEPFEIEHRVRPSPPLYPVFLSSLLSLPRPGGGVLPTYLSLHLLILFLFLSSRIGRQILDEAMEGKRHYQGSRYYFGGFPESVLHGDLHGQLLHSPRWPSECAT